MAALRALVRYFSYLFHLLLALFLIGVSGLAWGSGSQSLHLGMLPWTGPTLIRVVFFASVLGLISVILAVRGTWRFLFFLWCLAVMVLLIRGYAFTGYHFSPGEAPKAGWLVLGSVIALFGGWWAMFVNGNRRARY